MVWFLSRNDRNDEEEISLSSMKKKEKSKEFVYSIRERIIKKICKIISQTDNWRTDAIEI